jgi:crotonobetainyl-CoA:carnitine CoA-transferase CaiB-like acyl-CoA transferase
VPRFSSATGQVDHLGPTLGQHNDEVYGRLLGLGPDEIGTLRERGIL